MKKNEIDYNDVGTFPKFARAAIRIMLEILSCMMKNKDSPVISLRGQGVFLPEHIMKLFGYSVKKARQLRSDDDMEYMISEDGLTVFHLESHVQDYINKTFVSSRTPEGIRRRQLRSDRFIGAKSGTKS